MIDRPATLAGMKAYLLTTGIVFVLIAIAHVARLVEEGTHPLQQPAFLLSSALSIGLAVWAWRLFRQLPRK
ncbi:MAG TPA: hypothetical protein VFJ90_13025 [Candidatus Didemnitutus sp.]|nr:hypothetical protein [Candidatus Didemnitutus sp.]